MLAVRPRGAHSPRGASFPRVALDDRRTTLELAFDEAYAQAGITADSATHDNPTPTVHDVLDILEAMSDDPSEFVVRADAERDKLREAALWLLDQLRPFAEGGQFENLGRANEFDIRDEDVVYRDPVQQGGNMGGHTSLLMGLLISLVYEHANETDQEVVFVIDEACYLMKDASTLSYLETIFRHHRHHDLSIRLVTQIVDRFFRHDVAKMILDQCAIKQFHKFDGMSEEWANAFGMNAAETPFVQDAVPGSDEKGTPKRWWVLMATGRYRGLSVPTEPAIPDFEL